MNFLFNLVRYKIHFTASLGILLFVHNSLVNAASSSQLPETGYCQTVRFESARYIVCAYSPEQNNIRLFWRDSEGKIYGSFSNLKAELNKENKMLLFAMNAGMYHHNREPVGLYIENTNIHKPINLNEGPGNFHLLPNGVFYIRDNQIGVLESKVYIRNNIAPDYATQSGPMLVIDGELHPRFLETGTSKRIRNGVGVHTSANQVFFAMSLEPVNFYNFGQLFRDFLKTPNALYLDGTISKMYIESWEWSDIGLRMGPIIAVIKP